MHKMHVKLLHNFIFIIQGTLKFHMRVIL